MKLLLCLPAVPSSSNSSPLMTGKPSKLDTWLSAKLLLPVRRVFPRTWMRLWRWLVKASWTLTWESDMQLWLQLEFFWQSLPHLSKRSTIKNWCQFWLAIWRKKNHQRFRLKLFLPWLPLLTDSNKMTRMKQTQSKLKLCKNTLKTLCLLKPLSLNKESKIINKCSYKKFWVLSLPWLESLSLCLPCSTTL